MKRAVEWLLQGLGLAVLLMALAGEITSIQFRLYFGYDFKSFCERPINDRHYPH